MKWCGWSDSNRHLLRDRILSAARLPFRHIRETLAPMVSEHHSVNQKAFDYMRPLAVNAPLSVLAYAC